MKTYFRILSFAKPLSRYTIPYFIFALLSIIFGMVNYSLLMPVFDLLFNSVKPEYADHLPEFSFSMKYVKGVFDHYIWNLINDYGASGALLVVCVVLIITNFITNFFKYVYLRVINRARVAVVRNIRKVFYEKILSLHIGFFTNEKKGDLMSRLTNDVQEIEYSIVSTITVFFRDPISIIVWFGILFITSWELTLYSLIIIPITGGAIGYVGKKLKKESREGQTTLGTILSVIDETIGGLRVIKGFNAQRFIFEKFRKENDRYAALLKSITHKRELASPLSEVLGVVIVCVIVWLGGNMVLAGEMDASAFIFYIISYYNITVPIKSIASSASNIQRGLASGERIFKILDTENVITEKTDAKVLKEFANEVEFKGTTFSYLQEPVLLNVNLKIPKGRTVALVGPSGGGKSTLVDMIPRFYDPAEGQVLIDGEDIRNYTLESLRAQMGIVTQESILFNDTIYNNIAFGMENATMAEVIRAAQIANAHDFIMQTEQGYETLIGDRGSKLSGGQRQRLSIARAVLKNPPILILDEATSALDNESEKLVQEALTTLMKNRTSIVIAHRLSTVQHADLIVVLHKGEIIEKGTHQELLVRNGLYKKLYDSAGAFVE